MAGETMVETPKNVRIRQLPATLMAIATIAKHGRSQGRLPRV
jgi:hypothetical protein